MCTCNTTFLNQMKTLVLCRETCTGLSKCLCTCTPDTSSNELRDIVASLPHRYTALGGSILHVVFYVTFDLRHMKLLQGSERTEPKAAAKYDASPMACNEKDLISENISRNVALSCTSPKSLPTH